MRFCNSVFSKYFLAIVLLGLSFGPKNSWATKHIITFHSNAYSPTQLTASIGDTIEWQGQGVDFSLHPLQSTTSPGPAFSCSSGTVFDYVVSASGSYHYICKNHNACCNMNGDFTIAPASVSNGGSRAAFELYQNSPNPVSAFTQIAFNLHESGHATLRLFDTRGAVVGYLLESDLGPGMHKFNFDATKYSNGAYFYELDANGTVLRKQLIVQK